MKRAFLVPLTFLFVISFVHAKDFPLIGTPAVPAAKGKVEVKHGDHGNRKVKVEVKHLAKPSTLTPSATNYVVWIQPRGKAPENRGPLVVDDDLEGKLETTTPYDTFDVFVTAEDSPTVTDPHGQEVLRTTVQL